MILYGGAGVLLALAALSALWAVIDCLRNRSWKSAALLALLTLAFAGGAANLFNIANGGPFNPDDGAPRYR